MNGKKCDCILNASACYFGVQRLRLNLSAVFFNVVFFVANNEKSQCAVRKLVVTPFY